MEEEHYQTQGGDFRSDEVSYCRGFEAALHSKRRGRSYEECASELNEADRETATDGAFHREYQRGQHYHKRVRESARS